jgi:hypothetical protein
MTRLVCTACLLLALTANTAHASLISMNDAFYGVNSITRDTTTGFEWLDLSLSTNFTVNQLLSGGGGFLAQGFNLATLSQVEAMYTSGGWGGVDDTATAGSAGNLAFVQSIHSLFGLTGAGFNEGWALSTVPGQVSRPFNELPGGPIARVACTTSGFTAFATPLNSFGSCRMDYDQHYDFIGAWLVREHTAAVPEPGSAVTLLGAGLAAVAALRRRSSSR